MTDSRLTHSSKHPFTICYKNKRSKKINLCKFDTWEKEAISNGNVTKDLLFLAILRILEILQIFTARKAQKGYLWKNIR